jgi:cytochrome c oxidase assembly protein subunit 11
MQPGETRDMAVVFYVDPKLADDSEQDRVSTITLSYTFYPAREPEAPVNESAVLGKSRGI